MTTDDKHTAGEMVKFLLEAAVVFEVMWNPPQAIEANRLREAATLITSQAKEIAALKEALWQFIKWGESKCPCENEKPNPCPLCDASVENLEPCKAADKTIPPKLLARARSILASKGNEDAEYVASLARNGDSE